MKIPSRVCLLSLFCILLFSGCSKNASKSSKRDKVWFSEYFECSVTLNEGWRKAHLKTPGDSVDLPGKLQVAFMKKMESDLYLAYLINIGKDLPKDELSDADYLDTLREQFNSDSPYELIDEKKVTLHSELFYRFRHIATGGTKGPMAMYTHILRDGKYVINIQWSFPLEDKEIKETPVEITKFNSGVSLPL